MVMDGWPTVDVFHLYDNDDYDHDKIYMTA